MESFDFLRIALRKSEPYRQLATNLGHATGLPVAAAALVVDCLGEELGRSLLVVVPREVGAGEWMQAIECLGSRPGAGQRGSTVYFPAPSLTPYQESDVSLSVRAHEVTALDRLCSGERLNVVCTPRALFRRLPMPDDYRRDLLEIVPGEELPIEQLERHLVAVGYDRTDLVTAVGEFAVRGGVFDFYPPDRQSPVRLDLFGDQIESIRGFDAASQRSDEHLERLTVLPLDLFPGGGDTAERLAAVLGERLGGGASFEEIERARSLERGITFPGWRNFLPLLSETCFLGDVLDDRLVVALLPETLAREIGHFETLLGNQVENRLEQGRIALPPEELLFPSARARDLLRSADLVIDDLNSPTEAVDFHATSTDVFHTQLPRFPREVETARARGERLLVLSPSEHHPRIRETLEVHGVDFESGVAELHDGDLARGFRLPAAGVVVFSETQLFARRPSSAQAPRRRTAAFFSGLRDLKVGDFLVHSEHGIGQLVGLRSLDRLEETSIEIPRDAEAWAQAAKKSQVEVMEIVYSNDRTLLLPLSRLDQVQRYQGLEGVAPRLDSLGGSSWRKTKTRIRKSVRDMAEQLLKLYAERELARAPAMLPDSDLQHQFEAAFEFEETEDQLTAVAAIKEDLQSTRPMDRLLCGDVGFGKTEVAMRAALKVVDSGCQVAVLAPTTILADQHLETFRRRFADFPVVVEMVSRFRSNRELKQIAEGVRAQRIDILVGTHRILNRSLEFARLGLLIVDEEQRFGVAQKERLKELRKDVHVLAMSATPVPRTLQLSIAGVRDLSLIESPPKDRMAVETQILPSSDDLIREAIEFELERGGQVYFVHNRVSSIEKIAAHLLELVPNVRITVGHGQLDERELSRRMHAFTNHDYDVLVASTIIENGIDIPNVNTMLVHRADRFGLSQLYQLRGRVGRSDRLAYCYLLVPQDRLLSEDAQRRLQAIREFTDLGAGFRIAARDLEIRGAGNLLGAEQSGHITELGIEAYLRMLEDAVRELKGEAPREAPSTSLELPVVMTIPEDYIGDVNLRMDVYRRFGSTEESGSDVLEELRDRFGKPPAAVETLAAMADLKRVAERLRVQSISVQGGQLVFRMRQDSRIDIDRLIHFVSTRPDASFSPNGVLSLPLESLSGSVGLAQGTLEAMAG